MHNSTHTTTADRNWLFDRLATIGHSAQGMTPIDIGSVADHWAASPQEFWNIEDWPRCRPPYSIVFAEADFPSVLLNKDRQVQYTQHRFRFGCGVLTFSASNWAWARILPRAKSSTEFIDLFRKESTPSSCVLVSHLYLGGHNGIRSEGVLSHIFIDENGTERRRINSGMGLGSDLETARRISLRIDGLTNLALLAFSRLNSGQAHLTSDTNGRLHISTHPAYQGN